MKDKLDNLAELYVNFFDSVLSEEQKLGDSYVCDCEANYGGRCKYPEKYSTTGCNGK